jgi:hypothetical protein
VNSHTSAVTHATQITLTQAKKKNAPTINQKKMLMKTSHKIIQNVQMLPFNVHDQLKLQQHVLQLPFSKTVTTTNHQLNRKKKTMAQFNSHKFQKHHHAQLLFSQQLVQGFR